jgi:Ni/Co efflux regulator RcnB
MPGRLVLAMVVALVPTLAAAQEHRDEHGGERPGGARPALPPRAPLPPGAGRVGPGPGPQFRSGPVVGPQFRGEPGGGAQFRGGPGIGPREFGYRGRTFERVHVDPFFYPRGWGYRRWAVGAVLPPLFLVPAYYYADWASLGLAPPPPGFQWVRYGPDLLLVDLSTGEVADTVYGVFY